MTAAATPTRTVRAWTARERDWLRGHYRRLGPAACAAALGRTANGVRAAAHRFGAYRHRARLAAVAGLLRRAQEVGMPLRDQAAALATSVRQVLSWRRRLGLTGPSRALAEARESLAGEMRAWAAWHGEGEGKG